MKKNIFYKIKPTKTDSKEDNLLIFWQFRPCNIGGFKKFFKEDTWTYFLPLFIHESQNKLCNANTNEYILSLNKKELKNVSCNICESNKQLYNQINEIRQKINVDNVDEDIVGNSEKYSKLKAKLFDEKVRIKYLFLILDYNEYTNNKDNKDYNFELKWMIGDEEILINLQEISSIGYQLCNLSTLYLLHVIKDTNYDSIKYYVFPDKNLATLEEEHKKILNDADYELNLIKLTPFTTEQIHV